MDLVSTSCQHVAWTMAMDPSGREHVVVVAKDTFLIPDDGGELEKAPSEQQAPLVLADEFGGEPGFSAPMYEADFALVKQRCDVLLLATAYAPEGRPAPRVRVGVRVGGWSKLFDVIGDRVWQSSGLFVRPSAPLSFTTMPITYDRAFGGSDDTDPNHVDAYRPNPVGRGYGLSRSGRHLAGRPLPNTEAVDDAVTVPWGKYQPMSFGPIGRGWQPRVKYAGTYDQAWVDDVFPFLPRDFDDRYYQAAPADQQIGHPRGGEEVVLVNLTPQGRATFRLPTIELPVVFLPRAGGKEESRALLDTVFIEPDLGRVVLCWRATKPLRRNVFELAEVIVGPMSRAWWRARDLGKTYYFGLSQVVANRHAEGSE